MCIRDRDKDAQPALESSAGYKQFLIGAPHYLLLMSAPVSYTHLDVYKRQPMLSIGIDVSKGKSTVCGMKPGGEIVYTPFEVQHTREGISDYFSER